MLATKKQSTMLVHGASTSYVIDVVTLLSSQREEAGTNLIKRPRPNNIPLITTNLRTHGDPKTT